MTVFSTYRYVVTGGALLGLLWIANEVLAAFGEGAHHAPTADTADVTALLVATTLVALAIDATVRDLLRPDAPAALAAP
jgi:hypothetical protein